MLVMNKKVKYYLSQTGEFVIENYNLAKPFANFFPGIAGKYGIPMWVFYVNRGQGIASFGTKDKDHAILEFFPANKSWQLVSTYGFRTFIKINSGKKTLFYEPFQNGQVNAGFDLSNKMSIGPASLTIEEENSTLGLNIKIEYFNIPNDSYAGLARIVTLKNLSRNPKKIQLLDGLPQIVPFGTSNLFLKKLGRTVEAWMQVENLEKSAPFYKLSVDPTDRPEVVHIKEGNFYLGFFHEKKNSKIIRPIVDPETIFGPVTDFSLPSQFLSAKNFKPPQKETIASKMPCAFSLLNLNLDKNSQTTFSSLIGYMRNREFLNAQLTRITKSGYLKEKATENKELIGQLENNIATSSGSKEFDLYAGQTYLDNIMRGGYPVVFKTGANSSVFYLYSRKHGDLERDYNKFQLQPTYFSQGNGNYRDVNQNRRCDIWFNPQIKDENILTLLNLIQPDGFNPLVIKGASFKLTDAESLKNKLKGIAEDNETTQIITFLEKPFTPGEIIIFLEDNGIRLKIDSDEFLNILLTCSTQIQEAEHGEGFWTDHWTYNLDLLESYFGVYPEELKKLVLEKREFTFFDNTEVVKPRSEKYLFVNGVVRQMHSIYPDNAKREMIHKRKDFPHLVRADYGKGGVYKTCMMNKLLCLLVNKLASLDPFGCGIEMEADKPNWFDALNGLPALLGSSINETFELKRLAIFIKDALQKTEIQKVYITEEIYKFLIDLSSLVNGYLNDGYPDKDYKYWDNSHTLKEEYRKGVRFGFSGIELEMPASELAKILDNAVKKIDLGLAIGRDKNSDIYYSYFVNEVQESQALKPPFVKPLKFKQIKVPLFLEGQMHALRLAQAAKEAQSLYRATRTSALFDKKLKMYKVTSSLKDMPEEIGRCRVFTPGWLENESIWLHMEYKYLLETLKKGLYAEFYEDFKNTLIAFQKPARYGRSILENSSFLVSSVFSDERLHGNGFVARLSGSTAEFLSIWLLMNLGHKPFFLNAKNQLNLQFKPILAGWLFDRKGLYRFNFLGKIPVTYHNPKRSDTFGKQAALVKKIILNEGSASPVAFSSGTIPSPYAEQIRARKINQIDIYLE